MTELKINECNISSNQGMGRGFNICLALSSIFTVAVIALQHYQLLNNTAAYLMFLILGAALPISLGITFFVAKVFSRKFLLWSLVATLWLSLSLITITVIDLARADDRLAFSAHLTEQFIVTVRDRQLITASMCQQEYPFLHRPTKQLSYYFKDEKSATEYWDKLKESLLKYCSSVNDISSEADSN